MTGFKLDQDQQLDAPSSQDSELQQDVSGTKLGEVSDFEKELIETEVIESGSANLEQPVEVQAEKDEEKKPKDNLFEEYVDGVFDDVYEGQIVKAKIRLVKKSGVLVDFSYKSDGFIPSNEITDSVLNELEEGSELSVMIQKLETKEGYSLLSEKNARAEMVWDELYDKMQKKEVIQVSIEKVHAKGYLALYSGTSGFLHKADDVELSQGAEVNVLVQNVDKRRKKILFSMKGMDQVIKDKEESAEFLKSISVNDSLKGVVTGIKQFGVFVKVGPVEGLVHISELSWRRLSHPTDIVDIGDELDVKVLTIDLEECRLSLSVKQLVEDPWVTINEDFSVDQLVDAVVVRVTPFGVFLLIDNKVEGLLHISEISYKHIRNLDELFMVGEFVKVKVIKVSKDEQKIALTIKDVEQENTDLAERIKEL
jgi:small subunit ribosomal protein S1